MRESRTKRIGRKMAAYGTAVGVAAIAMMMILLPVTTATTIKAPFHGLAGSVGDNKSYGGCGKVTEKKSLRWHASTGILNGHGTATSPNCHGAQSAQNFADWISQVNLVGTLHFKANGSYNITNFWKVAWAATWNTTPFTNCTLNYAASQSECYESAEVQFYGQQLIYDQTTGTNFALAQAPTGYSANFANYSYVENYSYNACPTCTPSGGNFSSGTSLSGSFLGTTSVNSTIINYTVNNVDTYYYNVFCIVWVLTSAEVLNAHTTGTGSGTASVDFATTGKGVQLQAIVIH
jgi:hypothetical protein